MVADIQRIVAKAFKVTPNAIVGPCRLSEITKPRHLAMALAKRMTDESFPSLAFYFNRKDHTTVLHACRKAENIWSDKLDELEARVRRSVFKEAAE
jgi:chromosomal replication initiator protein